MGSFKTRARADGFFVLLLLQQHKAGRPRHGNNLLQPRLKQTMDPIRKPYNYRCARELTHRGEIPGLANTKIGHTSVPQSTRGKPT